MSAPLRFGLLSFLVVLLAESAWILAVPPFRGSDEIDHAYRAAGVASGQWHLNRGAPDGRGLLVEVPADLASAAHAQCVRLTYEGRDNCYPISEHDGKALVATSAGNYDPFFYAVIGTVAKPFTGESSLYAMRIAAALLCAIAVSVGAGALCAAGAGKWTALGLLTALTPTLVYSTAVAAPNGLEIALGLALWGSLLAAGRQGRDTRAERRLLVLAIGAAVPLTFIRGLGPLWVFVIFAVVACFHGRREVLALVRRHRRLTVAGGVLIAAGVAWWAAWMKISSKFVVPPHAVKQPPELTNLHYAFQVPAWILQTVGVFPFRDQAAPYVVYPMVLIVVVFLLLTAWRSCRLPRQRFALGVSVILSLVGPIPLNVVFASMGGPLWQGRYDLAFVVGILPLCGLLMDDTNRDVRGPWLLAAGLLVATSQGVCVVAMESRELASTVSTSDPLWPLVGRWLLVGLVLLASAVAARLFQITAPKEEPSARPE